jgi:transposase
LYLQAKDVARMLDVGEKTVQKWKSKMIKAEIKEEEVITNSDMQVNNEYVVEYLD